MKYVKNKIVIITQNQRSLGTSFKDFPNKYKINSIYAREPINIANKGTILNLREPRISPLNKCCTLRVLPQPGQ